MVVPAGPMLVGHHKGEVLGACTDCRRLWSAYRAGEIDEAEIEDGQRPPRAAEGTCMVMGTASTIACMVEALGLALPGGATIPATHADRVRLAEACRRRRRAAGGRRARRRGDPDARAPCATPSPCCRRSAGRPTRVIHFAAIAGRLGIAVDLDGVRRASASRCRSWSTSSRPGEHYMEHFHRAGGVPTLLAELGAADRPRAPHRGRRHAGRRHRRRGGRAGPERHPPAPTPIHAGGGAGGAARQSRPRRRHAETVGGDAGV